MKKVVIKLENSDRLKIKNRKAQVWIETVIYTLIAFAILGTVLSFARPKIEELQDKSIIEQSLKMLENIDETIKEIDMLGEGNKRKLELGIEKGSLEVNSENDSIVFKIETGHQYSEPGTSIKKGDIEIFTQEIGEMYSINATLDYAGEYNITWGEKESFELISSSPNPYIIYIENEGESMDFSYG